MTITAFYFLKVALCSAVLFGYYLAVLKDRKFHHYNRFYLLGIAVFSWIIPLIEIELTSSKTAYSPQTFQLAEVIADSNSNFENMLVSESQNFDWSSILNFTLLIISCIVAVGVVRSLFRIHRLIRLNPVLRLNGLKLVLTDANGTPYSFFSYVFWNQSVDLQSRVGKQMLAHEWVHAREKHSADKLFIELMMIAGWFNPVFWFLKKELYLIHEYIADSRSVENQDSSMLAELLLSAAYPQQKHLLTHSFFFSPIKRRMNMLKKISSPRFGYFRRLVVLPLAGMLILLFAFRTSEKSVVHADIEQQYLVVLDAGHGGHDAGAKSITGDKESEMSLAMVQRIAAFNRNSKIRFELSRDKDEYMKVTDRANFVAQKKADLFVSIHMNASPSNQRAGLEIYCPQKGSEGFLRSLPLAGTIKLSLDGIFSSAHVKTREKHAIWVLEKASVPAVIVLPGFITNESDLKIFQSRQDEIAARILKGIEDYLSQKEKGLIKLPTEKEWGQAAADSKSVNAEAFNDKSFSPPLIIGKKIEMVFDESMNLAALEKIREGFKKGNINLTYNKLEFDPHSGKLIFIQFAVDCNDGFKGSASLSLSNDKRIGFYRNYDPTAESPFGVGEIN
jgi:N-acetylmuramoyl-L-alanine amidase